MVKPLALLTVCLASIGIAACIPPLPIEDARAAFCAGLQVYGQAVQDVRDLPDDATVDDFRNEMRDVKDAYQELESSAWELADAQTAALQPEYDELLKSLDALNGGASLAETRAMIADGMARYTATYDEVTDVSCRPTR
jgi:hypothetical protein